jgi:hypothetical protein
MRRQVRQSDRAPATSALVETSAIEVSFCAPTALGGSRRLPQVFDPLVATRECEGERRSRRDTGYSAGTS